MRSLEAKWIIPVVALVVGLGAVLVPYWQALGHWQRCVDVPMNQRVPGYSCGFQPGPDWLVGLAVGIVAYFVLAGFVVAQRALEKK